MASFKNVMPDFIIAIHNGYEVRYYTTIESFATAVINGYAKSWDHRTNIYSDNDVKLFVPDNHPLTMQTISDALAVFDEKIHLHNTGQPVDGKFEKELRGKVKDIISQVTP